MQVTCCLLTLNLNLACSTTVSYWVMNFLQTAAVYGTKTPRKTDKDRFRQGLGGVVEAYEEVAARLGIDLSDI